MKFSFDRVGNLATAVPKRVQEQLAEATGEKRYAELAQALFDFQLRCPSPWDGPSSGKAAWACSMLYRQTGERQYRGIALHIAGNFISRQHPEGWFKGWAYVPLLRQAQIFDQGAHGIVVGLPDG